MTEPEDPQTFRATPDDNDANAENDVNAENVTGMSPVRRRRTPLTAAQLAASYPSQYVPPQPPEQPGFFARHRFAVVASAVALAFLLLASGAVAAGVSVGTAAADDELVEVPVDEAGRVVPDTIPGATDLRTCSISRLASAGSLGTLYASVVNADTGEALYDSRATEAAPAAGVEKILTAAAAIAVLGPDYQMVTRVVDNITEGSVVLVGGGDPTLSRLPEGQQSVYPDAPKLADLAAQTLATYESAHPGVAINEVVLDASYWDKADRWNSGWDRGLQEAGLLSEVTALQVDGDRDDPTSRTSARSTDPIMRAGQEFVEALGLENVTIRLGTAENGAPALAEVTSNTVENLVGVMLRTNDNTLAETLARVVSQQQDLDGTAASLQQAIPRALQGLGMDTSSLVIKDGSGQSAETMIPTSFISALMVEVSDNPLLKPVLDALPVAGETGGLSDRFGGGNSVAAGNVMAQTGAIETASSLGGVILAQDGTRLAFAFYGVGDDVSAETETALDSLAAATYKCGNNLSNN